MATAPATKNDPSQALKPKMVALKKPFGTLPISYEVVSSHQNISTSSLA